MKVDPGENAQQSLYGIVTLRTLSHSHKHVYAGTVPYAVKRKRRAKGKVSKRSRKVNR